MSSIAAQQNKKRFTPKNLWKSERMISSFYLFVSIVVALTTWYLISTFMGIGNIIVPPNEVWTALLRTIQDGTLWLNIKDSMIRVLGGFGLGILVSIPIAFLIGWYKPFRVVVEPWIQFARTIPPIALIPLVITIFGIGTEAKVAIIFFAVFLIMVVTIYQGVKNVDATLIKAAKVFDANDFQIFRYVVIPASFPFILVGTRLGLATSLTTLIAAELTGASSGIGNMIQQASLYFQMDVVLLGIVVIGVLGFILDRVILYLEKKLTSWQEVN